MSGKRFGSFAVLCLGCLTASLLTFGVVPGVVHGGGGGEEGVDVLPFQMRDRGEGGAVGSIDVQSASGEIRIVQGDPSRPSVMLAGHAEADLVADDSSEREASLRLTTLTSELAVSGTDGRVQIGGSFVLEVLQPNDVNQALIVDADRPAWLVLLLGELELGVPLAHQLDRVHVVRTMTLGRGVINLRHVRERAEGVMGDSSLDLGMVLLTASRDGAVRSDLAVFPGLSLPTVQVDTEVGHTQR